MHDWEYSLNNKRSSKQGEKICIKLVYSIKTNTIISFFTFLVKFLRNSIKYVVPRAVLGALLGALKVCTFEDYDYSKRIFR